MPCTCRGGTVALWTNDSGLWLGCLRRRRWLPCRSDNDAPLAGRGAFFGLSTLSVWWLCLGISIECTKPERPHQNGVATSACS